MASAAGAACTVRSDSHGSQPHTSQLSAGAHCHSAPTACSYTCTQVLRPGRIITLGALTLRLAAPAAAARATPPLSFLATLMLLRLKLPARLLLLLLVVRLNARAPLNLMPLLPLPAAGAL